MNRSTEITVKSEASEVRNVAGDVGLKVLSRFHGLPTRFLAGRKNEERVNGS